VHPATGRHADDHAARPHRAALVAGSEGAARRRGLRASACGCPRRRQCAPHGAAIPSRDGWTSRA
jgi:hypothetical protein